MTNASDNANIEKVEADTKAVMVNTLLNVASVIDKETILQNICKVLDIDYEEIKDKLPKSEAELNQEAQNLLSGE